MAAREIATGLGIPKTGYSLGNISRKCLEWVGKREGNGSDYSALRHGKNWGYLHAVPGIYPDAREWDVRACYFEMFCRLPSLRMFMYRDSLGFSPMKPDEVSRKRDFQNAIREHKLLRNMIVGCMTGGRVDGLKVANRGKWERRKLGGGAFPTAGNLIVRSGFELCQQAAHESNAVHAATDGIIEASGVKPRAWASVGLDTRLKAQGMADIRAWGAYKIGSKPPTAFYTDQIRHALEMNRPTVPETLYYKHWLA
jgi:hypothetical protein